MKTKLIMLGLVMAGTVGAQTTTNIYRVIPNVPNGQIPDGNPVGLMETFNVSGLTDSIFNIQVSLNISGGFNGNLYAYLAGPQGQLAVLLNRVGVTGGNAFGYSDAGLDITLDDASGGVNIHDYGTVFDYSLSGTTWTSDGRNVDPQAAGGVLYGTPATSGLNQFNGTDANGTWALFIADLAVGGGTPNLNSTALTIITVPEPQTWNLLGGGLIMFLLVSRHKRQFKI